MRILRIRRLLALFLFSLFTIIIGAHSTQPTIYRALIEGNMTVWKQTIDSLQKENLSQPLEIVALIGYQYGYINQMLTLNRKEQVAQYMKLMYTNMEKISTHNALHSYYYGYLGAYVAFNIRLTKWKAPVLGPKSLKHIDQALAIQPTNTIALLQKANGLFLTPALFGGSKEKAMLLYKRCEAIQLKNGVLQPHDWLCLQLLLTIAQRYEAMGDTNSAILYCKKIIALEPNYLFIKRIYLPTLLRKQ